MPPAARPRRVWRLQTHLATLLVASVALTFLIVYGAIVLWRLPAAQEQSLTALHRSTDKLAHRMEQLLLGRQNRLELLENLARVAAGPEEIDTLLDNSIQSTGTFSAFYRLSRTGTVTSAGLPAEQRLLRKSLVGSDLSALPLVRRALSRPGAVWSGSHLSPVTGTLTIAAAYRDPLGDTLLIGEGPREQLLSALRSASGARGERLWVVAPSGEVLAELGEGPNHTGHNIRTDPLMQALLAGTTPPEHMRLDGTRLLVSATHSRQLDWYFVGLAPDGLDNPQVQEVLRYAVGALAGGLLTGLLTAPFWARRLARPLQQIVRRTTSIASGQDRGQPWPRGPVEEFNILSDQLARMAEVLQQRESKLSAIFNSAPIPMAVLDTRDHMRILDVNDAWCRSMGYPREDALGRTGDDIGMWPSTQERDRLRQRLAAGHVSTEITVVRGDGQQALMQSFGRRVVLATEELMIVGSIDLGPLRRVEQQLRELNGALEARIAERTQALADSNETLHATVENLRHTRTELVRAEKMADLGALVAGVAHELNTPLGNGVMAVSTLQDAARNIHHHLQTGLRRADLQQFLEQVRTGLDITARNLHRAADLVQNFKQVAVDQTSAQRRDFELREVVHEMVVSLRPTIARTPYRILVELPSEGLRMDSYPGALGQTIGNLIQNAVLHGFDGRSHGTVRLSGERDADGWIVLHVADDGKGIPAALRERIFEPFVTTKKGQGGTGLGLHISYNAVVNLLGGSLSVRSEVGVGSCFTVRMPPRAPQAGSPEGTTTGNTSPIQAIFPHANPA